MQWEVEGQSVSQSTLLHNDVTDNRSDNVLPDTAYTIVKNANGSITFTPTKTYGTSATDSKVYSQIGSKWYDQYGVEKADTVATPTSTSTGSVSLFTAKQETIDNTNDKLKWTYTAATESTPAKLSAYYDVNNDDNADADEVKVNVALSNLYGSDKFPAATGAYQDNTMGNNWTMLGTGKTATFYYNDDVEEGATTAKLVDSVELDSAVTKDAYLAFDFDLNVKMDSVQVTYDENGNETVTAAQSTFTSGAPTNITSVTNGGTAPEAGALTWTNS